MRVDIACKLEKLLKNKSTEERIKFADEAISIMLRLQECATSDDYLLYRSLLEYGVGLALKRAKR